MNLAKSALIGAFLFVSTGAAPATAPSTAPSQELFQKGIDICRNVTFVNPEAGVKALSAMPKKDQELVVFLCSGYQQGVQDAVEVIQSQNSQGEAPRGHVA